MSRVLNMFHHAENKRIHNENIALLEKYDSLYHLYILSDKDYYIQREDILQTQSEECISVECNCTLAYIAYSDHTKLYSCRYITREEAQYKVQKHDYQDIIEAKDKEYNSYYAELEARYEPMITKYIIDQHINSNKNVILMHTPFKVLKKAA